MIRGQYILRKGPKSIYLTKKKKERQIFDPQKKKERQRSDTLRKNPTALELPKSDRNILDDPNTDSETVTSQCLSRTGILNECLLGTNYITTWMVKCDVFLSFFCES